MLENLDPTLLGIAFLIWPVTRSLIVLGAAATSMLTRNDRRQRAAERVLRALGSSSDSAGE